MLAYVHKGGANSYFEVVPWVDHAAAPIFFVPDTFVTARVSADHLGTAAPSEMLMISVCGNDNAVSDIEADELGAAIAG